MDSRVRTSVMAPTRVLIIDDHRAIGEALGRAVDCEEDLACAGVATTVDEAIALAAAPTVDAIVVDLDRPARDVVAFVRTLKIGAPGPAVLVVLPDVTPDALAACARSGADAVLRRGGSLHDILDAVRRPVRGAIVVDAATLAGLPTAERTAATSGPASLSMVPVDEERGPLTDRELDVLRLLGQGRDIRTISDELRISVHTARGYVKSILAKLGAHTQLEAVVVAQRRGYLSAP